MSNEKKKKFGDFDLEKFDGALVATGFITDDVVRQIEQIVSTAVSGAIGKQLREAADLAMNPVSFEIQEVKKKQEEAHPHTFVKVRGFDSATGLRRQ